MDEGGEVEDLEVKPLPGSDDDASIASIEVDQLFASDKHSEMDVAKGSVSGTEIVSEFSTGKLSASLLSISSESEDLKVQSSTNIDIHGGLAGLSGRQSRLFVDYIPLWGSISICGRRPEMEDAVIAVPCFHDIPISMLDITVGDISSNISCLPGHFFGVYDGHGGAQVADYCKVRIHLALIDEFRSMNRDATGFEDKNWQKKWEVVLKNCFLKVDDEISGRVVRSLEGSTSHALHEDCSLSSFLEPIAPETVGSTAVVAVMCSSYIFVANCGDSRAVLYRGKQPMLLSVDHKPDREDESQRIELAGGKIIQWNGFRVFGVLAMSRSIGDRYLRPWIIPEPEVTIVRRAREDECLILASDGLWDVISNEEACDVARRQILQWHKRNGGNICSTQRGGGTDPAAQSAADHLSRLALQKGSKDNITIVVVDLKAQRKFKNRLK